METEQHISKSKRAQSYTIFISRKTSDQQEFFTNIKSLEYSFRDFQFIQIPFKEFEFEIYYFAPIYCIQFNLFTLSF